MRVREKRKQKKGGKSDKSAKAEKRADKQQEGDKKKKAAKGIPPTVASSTPTLPAVERVAFDNRIKRKNVLALNEKVAALREYDRQPVYKHVGRIFNCSPDQIKRIVQNRDEILSAWEQRTRRSQDARTLEMKVVRVSMLGRAVYEWIRRMMYYKDFNISDGLIQKMALQFKSSMGLTHFFPHQEWCDKFRQTYNIQESETKQLTIGYTQGYSVQIKDIVKDVMSECTPETSAAIERELHEDDFSLGDDGSSFTSDSSHAHDNDDEDVDIDGGGSSDTNNDDNMDVKPSIDELNQARTMQPMPALVRLPMQTNAPGTSQKVLLATPIVPPGAAATGAQPITMTIIPLATLAQSITQLPSPTLRPLDVVNMNQTKNMTLPGPKLDLKREIKTEPKDSDEQCPEQSQSPDIRIKQELPSDEEPDDLGNDNDGDDDYNGGRSSVTSLAEVLATNVENEREYIEQTRAMRNRKHSLTPDPKQQTRVCSLSPVLPALTKRSAGKRHHDDNNNAGDEASNAADVSAVKKMHSAPISCSEARQCLKKLEEFALAEGNCRLIELFTRADEVMRELTTEEHRQSKNIPG